MIYPGYVPREGVEPILLHYGLLFRVGNWSFSKLEHHEDDIVYKCGKLFPEPPYPIEVHEPKIDNCSILFGIDYVVETSSYFNASFYFSL